MSIKSRFSKLSILAAAVACAAVPASASASDEKPRPQRSAPDVSVPNGEALARQSARRVARRGNGNGHGNTYVAGARSLGDGLFPQLGNGGYKVKQYDIDLEYDPVANTFGSGTDTKIFARATQNLSEFSLDFQDLDVSEVEVNGRDADFEQVEATPDLSPDPDVTQPMKLVVTPDNKSRPKKGKPFTVEVDYTGEPQVITDPDTSIEGWIPACFPLNPPQTCDGAFVVNEPMGANGWFPSNNHPSDKAEFKTEITVPDGKTALGIGELRSADLNGDGTRTWDWRTNDQAATYLTTATVGDFDDEFTTLSAGGRNLDVYNSIDSTATVAQKTQINGTLARVPEMLDFLRDHLGRYPFDSVGAVADRASGVGYALEVQTKPHYAGGFTSGNPSINSTTHLHELLHQWMGNEVSPATWHEIWFAEGWAQWFEWLWEFEADGTGVSPEDQFDTNYNDPAVDWSVAPAVLDDDPANLFFFDAVYLRSALMLEGYREIVGDGRFFGLARTLLARYGGGNVSLDQFVNQAVRRSGLHGSDRDLLEDYFQDWLFSESQPTILPEDF